ncbi:hypothetical protein HHK36_003207 [Tetracentron sinense]|uniref:Uncharacterized protein n=1 Tax=Tetracentron sinense TaxID=13715 RepID=A0A834ZNN8_TETSI|nr:hypothetical protein HHK36_003207 [Tetracentron sinense]
MPVSRTFKISEGVGAITEGFHGKGALHASPGSSTSLGQIYPVHASRKGAYNSEVRPLSYEPITLVKDKSARSLEANSDGLEESTDGVEVIINKRKKYSGKGRSSKRNRQRTIRRKRLQWVKKATIEAVPLSMVEEECSESLMTDLGKDIVEVLCVDVGLYQLDPNQNEERLLQKRGGVLGFNSIGPSNEPISSLQGPVPIDLVGLGFGILRGEDGEDPFGLEPIINKGGPGSCDADLVLSCFKNLPKVQSSNVGQEGEISAGRVSYAEVEEGGSKVGFWSGSSSSGRTLLTSVTLAPQLSKSVEMSPGLRSPPESSESSGELRLKQPICGILGVGSSMGRDSGFLHLPLSISKEGQFGSKVHSDFEGAVEGKVEMVPPSISACRSEADPSAHSSPREEVEAEDVGSGHVELGVADREFLPARKVKEKASKLRSTLTADILSSTTSRNILAMTFRQVVLQQLWSFELVPAFFTLSSSDGRDLSVLAEAVCMSAFESTERDFFENSPSTTSNNIFRWFQKPKRIASRDSSVFIYKIFQDEIVKNATNLLENFNATKENYKPRDVKMKHHWWTASIYSKLENIGGPEFSAWTSKYIPVYRLQIDADKLKNVKFEGWKKSAENRWEVLLTHSQMVGLANILDMFYEDPHTLPGKELSCGVVVDFTNLSKDKRSTSLWKVLSITLASLFVLVSINVLGQLCWPHLYRGRKYPAEHCSPPLSEIGFYQHQSLEATKVEALCISIVKKIKDAFHWPGDIITETDIGAWTGELPSYLRLLGEGFSSNEDAIHSITSEESNADMKTTSAQDIASYQVVMSNDGKIVGFQPTSRVAVNHWASNPLAKELYSGRKLSPGLIETGLNVPRPNDIVAIELLMSINSESWFALARPITGLGDLGPNLMIVKGDRLIASSYRLMIWIVSSSNLQGQQMSRQFQEAMQAQLGSVEKLGRMAPNLSKQSIHHPSLENARPALVRIHLVQSSTYETLHETSRANYIRRQTNKDDSRT